MPQTEWGYYYKYLLLEVMKGERPEVKMPENSVLCKGLLPLQTDILLCSSFMADGGWEIHA